MNSIQNKKLHNPLTNFCFSEDDNDKNQGSTILKQTEVVDRMAGEVARNSIQGVIATQSSIIEKFYLFRRISSSAPPIASAHNNESKISSIHNIEGVFIVSTSKNPFIGSLFFFILKIFGIGHFGFQRIGRGPA